MFKNTSALDASHCRSLHFERSVEIMGLRKLYDILQCMKRSKHVEAALLTAGSINQEKLDALTFRKQAAGCLVGR